jgi:uncharacterized membrane protein YeaQ/YmgE (transglycosylase-associated protein family)
MNSEVIQFIGGLAFGAVVGWVTYFILRRAQPKTLSDITTIIGAIGGAAITGLFTKGETGFAGYAIGLAIGFFVYYVVYRMIVGKDAIREALVKGSAGAPLGGGEGGESPVDWGADRPKKAQK